MNTLNKLGNENVTLLSKKKKNARFFVKTTKFSAGANVGEKCIFTII